MPAVPAGQVRVGSGAERLRRLRGWKVPRDYWRIGGGRLCLVHSWEGLYNSSGDGRVCLCRMRWSHLLSFARTHHMHRLWCWKLQEFSFRGLHMHHLPRWNHFFKWFCSRLRQLRSWEAPCDYWRIVGHTLCLMHWSNLLSRWSRRMHRLWCWKLQEFSFRGLHMHHLPRWNHFFKWFCSRLRQLRSWDHCCISWSNPVQPLRNWDHICISWSIPVRQLRCWDHSCISWSIPVRQL